ncbi:MAG: hypothetical protein AB1403_04550 [Candidatus Riflebacteria bacterium]
MASAKKIKTFFSVLFLIFLAWSAIAKEWPASLSHDEGKVKIRFSEEIALSLLKIPVVSTSFWGQNMACRAATLKINDQSFIASAKPGEVYLIFKLDHQICREAFLTPVFIESTDKQGDSPAYFEARNAEIRRSELELFRQSREILQFHEKNRCFSCHTLLPLAITINQADQKGIGIPLEEIEKIGESLTAMQNPDGSFFFPEQPDYGKITTSLCAGAIFSILLRFDRRLIVNLQRLKRLLPSWTDEENDMKSDFFFRPLFLGKVTSALFEALIISSLYYHQTAITSEMPDDELRQRLIHLNRRFKIDLTMPFGQNLIILLGLPYFGQISDHQIQPVLDSMDQWQQTESQANRPDCAAISALIMKRLNNEKGLQQIKLLQTANQTLSQKIWLNLIRVLQSQP